MKHHLKIWEISLLMALCITLCTGLFARAQQQQLSRELVRLHVIANSDSESDQQAKLKVRDCVLSELSPKLDGVSDIKTAESIIIESMPELCYIARRSLKQSGKLYSVSAKLCLENYPTRDYEDFSLPAGEYISLQVIIGEGKGRNWWCVVFPPLCMTSVEDEDAFSNLSDNNVKLIKEDGNEYKIKFRVIEMYDEFRRVLS